MDAATSKGLTPLHMAVKAGHREMVQQLLAAGASMQAQDSDGIAPLYAAAAEGQFEVVKLLLAAGAPVNTAVPEDGRAPLYAAATARHTDVVRLLLQKGAEPYPQNRSGGTSVSVAAARGYDDVVEILMKAWGQFSLTSDQLVYATKPAMTSQAHLQN